MSSDSTASPPWDKDPGDLLGEIGVSWAWWLVGGILTLVAGIILLSWPHATVRVAAVVIGLQLLLSGVVRFVRAFGQRDPADSSRGLQVLVALLAILAGVLVLRHQLQTVGFLTILVGLYWLVGGVVTIYLAIDRPIPHRGWILALGSLGVVAGVVLLSSPVNSAIVLTRLLGVWLILMGALDLLLAVVVRMGRRRVGPS
ncbi:HdeD family acid-resistance protein [Streptacidiphilus fuscans]|uniref:HdeD family acid-resistance protein n=1 Tax=Streptacidiphilus fuscans TaxID=2789292 RepID=A0A931AYJ3_9ACTN|nr:HdeD family acid-resistance protein [Streptacidiphilus fuscans]MBF9067091.1 HdeD family acid-resistance protein [Streptacidiphilus fuscans]